MIQLEMIGGFNPFEWDDLKCPGCKANDFVSYSMAGVFCQNCETKFEIRMTGGDPGLVIDAWVTTRASDGKPSKKYFCLVLKLGDYCSGWMPGPSVKSIGYPTEKQWDKYKETLEVKPGYGSTINARFIIERGSDEKI